MIESSCTRRGFFAEFGRSVARNIVNSVGALQEHRSDDPPPSDERQPQAWLRPPGALPETQFLKTCTRCTDCLDACPYQAIRRLGPEHNEASGTPAIIPTESPCYLCEDMPCITACSPAALQPTSRESVSMGIALIDYRSCYVVQGQPCDYCVTKCPIGETAISFDDSGMPIASPEGCTGCGVCSYLCPAGAIKIEPALIQSLLIEKDTKHESQ